MRSRTSLLGTICVAFLLTTLIALPVRSQAPATITEEEKAKQIAAMEKLLTETQAKLAELKKTPTIPAGALPESISNKFAWRCIGPANMGGRITAMAVNEKDPSNFWIATASGGLLCTKNNGTTFDFQFDNQATVSIGDVAVSASNPNVVWVGTGEANPRNSVSYGDGVYKSTDGGKTFKNMGLSKTFQIGKIEIHPKNPDIVYIGALGRLYGPNQERGVFKTTDGGKTWEHILHPDDKTGVIDMRLDPTDPNTIIVAMWERKRDAFDGFFGTPPVPDMYGPVVTHGAGGGLWKSTDAGKNWVKLNDPKKPNGLPTVKTGRIGLDYSRKSKGLIYAIIDTEKVGTGLLTTTYFGAVIVNDENAAKLTEVTKDSPAEKGGLKNGDIVTQVDDQKVGNADAFIDYFMSKVPDTTIKVTIKRDGKEQVISVKLGQRNPTGPPPTPIAGFTFEKGTKAVVLSVVDNSPAERAGMKAKDEITAVDGKAIANATDYTNAIKGKKPGDKVKYTVKRDKETKELEITLAASNQGGRGQTNDRPYGLGLGGQQANVQVRQGPDGYQTGGVYMSKDNGDTWTRVNSLNPRPMYYCVVRVDPSDDNVIYVLGDTPTPLWRSSNGGRTMNLVMTASGVHADAHALWVDPRDGRHLILGCDGGFYSTYDTGATWEHLNNHALGQFYHICVDTNKPYRVYGGLQDNGSWGGTSDTLRRTGPVNEDWKFVSGGDGFVCRTDPTDPDWVYTESQGGFISRRNYRTGQSGGIQLPPKKEGDPPVRFNWNTPFILSSHNPSIFYCGAQYVYRSVKRGDDLKMISPELTRTKAGSLTAIAESPKNADVLWAGSDDGYLWITKDGGAKWENVTEKVQKAGLPVNRWISTIETSRYEAGRAYVTFDAHRLDDDKPYIYVTEDFGNTWKPLHKNLPQFGSTRVCREDIVNANVLYAGTEFGAFVSIDRGEHWTKLGSGLPTVACHEFAQPTTANDLVVGTHGRSVWVLDINAIRQLNPLALKASSILFQPSPAIRWKIMPSSESAYSRTDHKFFGTNPTRGANFDILVTTKSKKVSLSVVDAAGTTIWKAEDPNPNRRSGIPLTEPGLHRLNWNLFNGPAGKPASPGTYKVVLNVDDKEYVKSLTVELDPNAAKDLVSTEDDLEASEKARKARRIELRLDN